MGRMATAVKVPSARLPARKGHSHAQANSVYSDRIVGGNRHHCIIAGDTHADTKPGQETGQGGGLPVEPVTMGADLVDVRGPLRRLLLQRL